MLRVVQVAEFKRLVKLLANLEPGKQKAFSQEVVVEGSEATLLTAR